MTAERLTSAGQSSSAAMILDWVVLLRLRVALMVFVVSMVGGILAVGGTHEWLRCAEASLYITLATGCASILNQVWERRTDALMERTRNRPLVTGRVTPGPAVAVAVVLGALGTAGLWLAFNGSSALLILATLASYLFIYTPLKRVSRLNTLFGAIPGAAPPLISYLALADGLGPWAWSVFWTLYVWQFPHFMAIAWLYREDYARAGLQMAGGIGSPPGTAGRNAVVYSLILLPVSLLPGIVHMAGPVYTMGTVMLGAAYLGASIAFMLRESKSMAQALMFTSLVYLPLQLSLMFLDSVVWAAIQAR